MAEWLETCRGVCMPAWTDRFGHMNVRYYGHFFDDGAFHIWSRVGVGVKAMLEMGVHTVTARNTINYLQEVHSGDLVVVHGGFTRVGSKSVTIYQKMFDADSMEPRATYETVEVFFDPQTRKSAVMPDAVREVLQANLLEV